MLSFSFIGFLLLLSFEDFAETLVSSVQMLIRSSFEYNSFKGIIKSMKILKIMRKEINFIKSYTNFQL